MKKENRGKLKIIPLGGLEQIGMNITAFEYEDSIIVVDCGLAFPEDDMLGIDLVIPDVTYLKDNISKVKGFVITHGHEDHIGALPYVLKEINLPIYTTKLTMGIIENKLKEHNLLRTTKRKVVRHGQSINLGQFRIEFIKTNHSIQDASALAIYSPAGTVVHTGDFKVDYTPVFGDAIDLQRFAEIGKKGVLALMSDSTNAERKGFTQSERTVGITFDHIFAEHQNTRIIIATFASNVDRVQQIINSAYKYGRKVVVEGRSMVSIITTASELGYLNVPENTLIEIDQVDGLGVGDVGNIVLRDRQHLAEDGILIVVLTLEKGSNNLLAGPDIVSRGFVYVRESEGLMEEARKVVTDSLDKCLSGRHADWNKIKMTIRDTMNDFIWKKTKRRPMVIPIIMDV